MNRRDFFKLTGGVAAAVVAAKVLPAAESPQGNVQSGNLEVPNEYHASPAVCELNRLMGEKFEANVMASFENEMPMYFF